MKITVSDIPEEGLDFELRDVIVSDAVKILTPVSAGLRVEKIGPDVLIRGSLSGDVEIECSRCLQHVPFHVATPVSVAYHPVHELPKADIRELRGDELDTVFYDHDQIDTDELLRDQLVLNLPMKPLCTAECRGICPRCGADRNTTPCTCENADTDSRFGVLKQLLEEKE